jgi:hypothetical protein
MAAAAIRAVAESIMDVPTRITIAVAAKANCFSA